MASHLASCFLLLRFYKCCHPWRELIEWQKIEVTRTGVNEETPFWEQVSTTLILARLNLCAQDDFEATKLLHKVSEGTEVGYLKIQFLDTQVFLAPTQYPCQSVRPSVCWSNGPSYF